MIPVEYGTSVDLCVFVCVWPEHPFVAIISSCGCVEPSVVLNVLVGVPRVCARVCMCRSTLGVTGSPCWGMTTSARS